MATDARIAADRAIDWAPVWLGWAPLERVLDGSRARVWADEPAAAELQQRQRIIGGTD